MKHLRILGLAAVAAMALMAFGVGTASATTLDNGGGEHLSSGAVIDGELLHTRILTTSGQEMNTCTGGTFKVTTANTGSATETVRSTVVPSGLTWGSCTRPVETLSGGELEIHHISGTSNGTVTAGAFDITVNYGGFDCTYGAGAGRDIGVLTGSDTAPVMHIDAVLLEVTKDEFFCPNDVVLKVTIDIEKPSGLTVTAG